MKDINKLKDYRKKYKRFYTIEFNEDFAIHHIDFDRSNNDISNLLLLPKELHARYHLIVNALSICPQTLRASGFIDIRLSSEAVTDYGATMLNKLPETLSECRKWLMWKEASYSEEARKIIFNER